MPMTYDWSQMKSSQLHMDSVYPSFDALVDCYSYSVTWGTAFNFHNRTMHAELWRRTLCMWRVHITHQWYTQSVINWVGCRRPQYMIWRACCMVPGYWAVSEFSSLGSRENRVSEWRPWFGGKWEGWGMRESWESTNDIRVIFTN